MLIKKNIIEDQRTPDFVKQGSKDELEEEMVKAFDTKDTKDKECKDTKLIKV